MNHDFEQLDRSWSKSLFIWIHAEKLISIQCALNLPSNLVTYRSKNCNSKDTDPIRLSSSYIWIYWEVMKNSQPNPFPQISILIFSHWNTDLGKWIKMITFQQNMTKSPVQLLITIISTKLNENYCHYL